MQWSYSPSNTIRRVVDLARSYHHVQYFVSNLIWEFILPVSIDKHLTCSIITAGLYYIQGEIYWTFGGTERFGCPKAEAEKKNEFWGIFGTYPYGIFLRILEIKLTPLRVKKLKRDIFCIYCNLLTVYLFTNPIRDPIHLDSKATYTLCSRSIYPPR